MTDQDCGLKCKIVDLFNAVKLTKTNKFAFWTLENERQTDFIPVHPNSDCTTSLAKMKRMFVFCKVLLLQGSNPACGRHHKQ